MRLIDAEALIRELEGIKVTFGSGNGLVEGGIEIAISTTNAQPTVDAVQVVRCKDCKHIITHDGDIICEHLSGMVGLNVTVNANDYCSYGERRSE